MTVITRYSGTQISQLVEKDKYGDWTEISWTALDKINAHDNVYAVTYPITAKTGVGSKPARIVCSDFGFNLKNNARINKVTVQWSAHVRNSSGGTTKVPIIPGVKVEITGSGWVSSE